MLELLEIEENIGMYANAKTYNPAVGCLHNCIYCVPSFQRQVKRVASRIGCSLCAKYYPHEHPERLKPNKIPNSDIVFVFGDGDITFYREEYVRQVFKVIDEHERKSMKPKLYYFQSKNPICFNKYLDWFKQHTDKVILLTTLETNRDENYEEISRAPKPYRRFIDFYKLDYPHKAVTIEPVLDFDLDIFLNWMLMLKELEYIWIGYNSKPKAVSLPEPNREKLKQFIIELLRNGIRVRGKNLRGLGNEIKNELIRCT